MYTNTRLRYTHAHPLSRTHGLGQGKKVKGSSYPTPSARCRDGLRRDRVPYKSETLWPVPFNSCFSPECPSASTQPIRTQHHVARTPAQILLFLFLLQKMTAYIMCILGAGIIGLRPIIVLSRTGMWASFCFQHIFYVFFFLGGGGVGGRGSSTLGLSFGKNTEHTLMEHFTRTPRESLNGSIAKSIRRFLKNGIVKKKKKKKMSA